MDYPDDLTPVFLIVLPIMGCLLVGMFCDIGMRLWQAVAAVAAIIGIITWATPS